MRLVSPQLQTKLHTKLRTAALAALLLAASACQTAQKPVSLLPPGSTPALQPAPAPARVPAPAAQTAAAQAPAPPQKAAAPDAAAPNQPSAQVSDPVADLIAGAEKEYQAGLASYHAGQHEEAKQDFDNALNALLSSNLDIRSDDRLQKEFDHIVQGVNELYPGGPAASDSDAPQEAQQKSEPAPIDITNDATNGITPAADAGVAAKAQAEIKHTRSDLPLMMTDQVAGYITYFSGRGRGVFERAFARSGRYHDMIVTTLKDEGVPQDLIYLAQAESGFHPLAVSRAGARGIWQFMASRGRGYGLDHYQWVDDRQDPEKSTRAAARHLKDLYAQFGDWYLAMAAYNSGPGTVQAAVKRTGYADFWELYRRNVLPKETRNYVPIILAVTIMAKNPAQYGLDSVVKEKPIPYDTVKIDYPIDLRLAAECVDATAEDLLDLNPSLLRMTTPKFTGDDKEFELHLPAGTADKFETAVASIPADKRVWWRYHKVQAGETLAAIARTYHTTPRAISEANDLNDGLNGGSNSRSNNAALAPETRLIIPIAPGKQSDLSTYSHAVTRYHVRKGDTVESVAENFGVSEKMLRFWNHLPGSGLAGRKVLYIHLPVTPSARETQVASRHSDVAASHHHAAATKQTASVSRSSNLPSNQTASAAGHAAVKHHKVKQGETLYSIANSYNTTVSALKHDNRNIASLRPGMILIIRDVR